MNSQRENKTYIFQVYKVTTTYNNLQEITNTNIDLLHTEEYQYQDELDDYVHEELVLEDSLLGKYYEIVSIIEEKYRRNNEAKVTKDITFKKSFYNRGMRMYLEIPYIEFTKTNEKCKQIESYFCNLNFINEKNNIEEDVINLSTWICETD